jgi:cytochrome b6-f complex iron-sulfur subunit
MAKRKRQRSYIKEEPQNQAEMTRRKFLGWAWFGTMAGLLSSSGYSIYSYLKPLLEGSFGGKINLGLASLFSEKGSITHVNDARLYVSHVEDEESGESGVLAMWQRCTHLGCTVPWIEEEEHFHCPCHGSVFNKKGEVLDGPAPRPMDIFPVEYNEKDELVADTGNVIERSSYEPEQLFKGS